MSEDGRPSFRDVLNSLTPRGTEPSALLKALKDAQARPLPGIAPDISLTPEGRQRYCINCGETHDYRARCPGSGSPVLRVPFSPPPMPEDPFSSGHVAGVGLAEMLADMTGAGIPPASAERILGAMLAAYGLMSAAEGETREQS